MRVLIAWDAMSWLDDAEPTAGSDLAMMLGEDDNGDIYAGRGDHWRPFSWRRPSHWLAYLRSRQARTVAILQPIDESEATR